MEWLNYHHLFYFWTVAKEGSIVRACEKLRLAQPTISGQLRLLEEDLGQKLFAKSGRGLVLTEIGQIVNTYAEEIFGLGRELQDVLRGRPRDRPLRFRVGVSDMVPKLIAHRVLQPVLTMAEPVHLVCHEDAPEHLLADLAEHRLDMVLSDAPLTSLVSVKAYNHLLGASPVALFAAPELAERYTPGFPSSLDRAPFLLPIQGASLRRSLDRWFDLNRIRPGIVGEFKDSALLKAFGDEGAGIFAAPAAIEPEITRHYQVKTIGRVDQVTEQFFAISVERKLKHPAVVATCEAARSDLFRDLDLPINK